MTERSPRKPTRRQNTPRELEPNGFHATPPEGIRRLFQVEAFADPVYDPACGEGHISREVEAGGLDVLSSDLIDRGYGVPGVDFRSDTLGSSWRSLMTNPPFALHMAFIQRGLQLLDERGWEGNRRGPAGLALLFPLTYLAGIERGALFRERPPARAWVFSRRIICVKGGSQGEITGNGAVDYVWLVWRKPRLTAHPSAPAALGWL